MSIHKKGRNETLLDRPSELRVRRRLSNGQLLSVYFRRHKSLEAGEKVVYVWTVGVHIGKGRKEANRWYHGGGAENYPLNKSTGECGLEGLVQAGKYIREFGYNLMGRRSEMQIGWIDEKRMRAYKFLLRYEGFTLYEGECIAFRNPEFYTWIPKDKGRTNEGREEIQAL